VEIWQAIRFLHLVGVAVFVGGQLLLTAVVAPGLRGQPEEVMRGIARRFGMVSAAAIVVLVATGIAMASHYSRWGDSTLHAKLAVIALIGVLMGAHVVAPRARAVSLALIVSSLVVVWLGVQLAH
jgi:uncharacterized membrane protein